jgi:PAS domain S-box-containing protein
MPNDQQARCRVVAQKNRRSDPNANIGRTAPADEDTYRSIVENVSEVLALIGADSTIQYVNSYIEKALGYRNDEVKGRNVFDFVHPEDVTRAAEEYSDTLQHEGERAPSVLRLRDAAGAWIPFEIIANNQLQDPDIQAVIFTARDLRFRKEIEDAISRANTDIEKRVEERTTELAKINAALRIENQARRQAENHSQHTVSLLNATLDSTADGILVVSNDGKITSCNQKFVEMWSVSCE